MPELKRSFTGGKMNKDLDERIVPNGEYRDAMNIQVSTSEGSDVGAVQNLLGNFYVPDNDIIPDNRVCLGSISDEKDDALYWFVASTGQYQPEYIMQEGGTTGGGGPQARVAGEAENSGGTEQRTGSITTSWFHAETDGDSILQYKNGNITPVVVDIKTLVVSLNDFIEYIGYNHYQLSYSNIAMVAVGMKLQRIDILQTPITAGSPGTVINSYDFSANPPTVISKDISTQTFALDFEPAALSTLLFSGYNPPADNIIAFVFGGSENRALNFQPDTMITGINVIDNMLFWTDNYNEPKKVNIPRCIGATGYSGGGNALYTRIVNLPRGIGANSNRPLELEHVSVMRQAPSKAPQLELVTGRNYANVQPLSGIAEVYTGVVTVTQELPSSSQTDDIILSSGPDQYPYDFSTASPGHELNLTIAEDYYGNQNFQLMWGGSAQELIGKEVVLKEYSEDNTIAPAIPITDYRIKAKITGSPGGFPLVTTASGTSLIQIKIEITSIDGFPPGASDVGGGIRKYAIDIYDVTEKLFEFKFPRFATRYKYQDGEYSSFSPFTEVAFVPGSFDYHPKKGYNLGMTNQVKEVIIKNFRPTDMPLDVAEVDILYKEDASPNIYVVDTIRPDDLSNQYWENDTYSVKDETIHSALPSNQFIRMWDNVPKRALGQEVTGNRLVYANYTQGFDLLLPSPPQGNFYLARRPYTPNFELQIINQFHPLGFTGDLSPAIKSIKSLREYQIGVVFLDNFGRETPVISNPSGTFKLEKDVAGQSNRIRVGLTGDEPEGMAYYKFYIKETSGEYYNMAMDRYYDAADGNIWLAFPSSDRNKVDIDTFLILKKSAHSSQPVLEPARYKILAIENEAPDYVKTSKNRLFDAEHASSGTITTTNNLFAYGGAAGNTIPQSGRDNFEMDYDNHFKSTNGDRLHEINDAELYVSFSINNVPGTSDRYKVLQISTDAFDDNAPTDPKYYVKLDRPLGSDVDFIIDNNPASGTIGIKPSAVINIFKYKVNNKPQFDGRFFVKIYKDDIFTNYIQQQISGTNYRVVNSRMIYLLRPWDIHKQSHSDRATGHGYGLGTLHNNTGTAEMQNAYSGDFGRYACYFRKYDFGNSNPGTHYTLGQNPSTDGGANGIGNEYNPEYCRYKFRSPTGSWGSTASGWGSISWYPTLPGVNNIPAGNVWATQNSWLEEYTSYTGHSYFSDGAGGLPHSLFINPYKQYAGSAYYERADTYLDTHQKIADKGALRRAEEVWFIDMGQYVHKSPSDNLNWKEVPGASTATNDTPGTFDGMAGGSATTASSRWHHFYLGFGPIIHDAGGHPTIDENQTTDQFVNDLWNIGDSSGNSEYANDTNHIDFVSRLAAGTTWKWKDDPYDVLFSMGVDTSGGTPISSSHYPKPRNIMRYWGGSWLQDGMGAGSGKNERIVDLEGVSVYDMFNGTFNPPHEELPMMNRGAQLSTNFNKTWHWINFHENQMSWVPAVLGTNVQDEIGPIKNGLQTQMTTSASSQVHNNTANIDEYYIVVTKSSFDNAVDDSDSTVKINIGIGNWIVYRYHTTYLSAAEGSGNVTSPFLAVRKVELAPDEQNYHVYLTGYIEALDLTHTFDPGGSRTVYFAQPTMNGYTENSSARISIQKSYTGLGAYTSSNGGNCASLPCTTLLKAVGYEMQFLEEFDDDAVVPENPAIWETEPKDFTDLDIYYEASDWIPINLNSDYSRTLVSLFMDAGYSPEGGTAYSSFISSNANWFNPGFSIPIGTVVMRIQNNILWLSHTIGSGVASSLPVDQFSESQRTVNITMLDGSIVTTIVEEIIADQNGNYTGIRIKENTFNNIYALSWHNCYSFLNGVESNRIRDNFNLPFISNGVGVSTTLETDGYREEHRKHGLIHSGIYNSISNINNLNQFIAGEKITKDLNPIYGSIQKLHSRDTDLITLCEDKVLKVLANKDAVFNADGNPNLTATGNVLGQTIPFIGEYGISKNPESFASQSYRAYFADKQRGAIIRLSKDGLTPISDHGMKDWFRDNLKLSNQLVGSFDDRQGEYNISIKDEGYVVSFDEDVRGWVSFKSFGQMEDGLSMANDYYTFYLGKIYQHHHSNTNFNTFYATSTSGGGIQTPSSVTVLLNEMPGMIKTFQTMSYEGSQANVTAPRDKDGNLVDDGQYYNFTGTNGWYVSNFRTDLDQGGLFELIEKEGKWFNYIRAICERAPNDELFSYQGLGVVQTINITDPNGDAIDPVPIARTGIEQNNTQDVDVQIVRNQNRINNNSNETY